MDIEKIKQRLNQLQQSNKRSNNLWKPPPGDSIIRILPYAFDKDSPFVELFFHYNLNNKSYLAPITFGRPDPIENFANKLKQSGIQEDYKVGKQLEAKMRTFAVIVVRGEESEGPRFWGFGKTVYEELMAVMVDPDYGDITDLINGRDVSINFKTAKELNASFPKTSIRVKPNITPASEDRAFLDSLLENQTRVTELYPELSYDELEQVMNDWLKIGTDESDENNTPVTESELVSAAASPEDLDEFFDDEKSK